MDTIEMDEDNRSILALFRDVVAGTQGERITIGDLLEGMRERAFGALILLFALPNALPTPPGTSTILGFPLLILSAQFALGLPVWLPRFITARSIKRADFEAMLAKAEPWLQRAERLLKPRLAVFSNYPAERFVGIVALILSIVLVLPIPLGNMPPAIALCLMALGLLAADGLFVAAGLVAAVISLVIAWGVVLGLAAGAWLALQQFFA